MPKSSRRPGRAEHVEWFGGQIPALGRGAQHALRTARVWVSGAGRIGSAVVLQNAAVGIGTTLVNDPQVLDVSDLGALIYARPSDLGRPKASVLERFVQGRPNVAVESLACPTESACVDGFARQAGLIISCANTAAARLAAESKAVELRKAILQVAASDGRTKLGGVITLRLPENNWSACFGCYLGKAAEFPRGEGLLATATSVLASMAVNMAVQILTGIRSQRVKRHNYFMIDLEQYRIEALAVRRRPDCPVCAISPVPAENDFRRPRGVKEF